MRNLAVLPKVVTLLAGAALAALILAGSYYRVLDNYELELLDMRFFLRGDRPTTTAVALIEIGDDTIEKLAQWPLDRTYYALIVRALMQAQAKAVMFDMLFADPMPNDDQLAEAVKEAGNVYLPVVFDLKRPERGANLISSDTMVAGPVEALQGTAKGIGQINIVPDSDGKYRRVPAYVDYRGELVPSLALPMVCDYLGIAKESITFSAGKYLALGDDVRIPLDEDSCVVINFSGPWVKTFEHYSFVDILQSYFATLTGNEPLVDLERLKGKMCIIGLTATGTVDLHPNPWERLYPAVGIHAELVNSVLNRSFIRRVSRAASLGILVFLGLVMTVVTLMTRPVRGLLILLLVLSAFFAVSLLVFNRFGIWIDLFYPVLVLSFLYLGLTFYRYIVELQRRQIMENELAIATQIQESFLPKEMPHVDGVEMAAKMYAARHVGGDLYDILDLGGGRLDIIVGDVSGKGVPASLYMAKVISEVRFFVSADTPPHTVLTELNDKLSVGSTSNLFVTTFYLSLNARERTATFSNGGHLPAILAKAKTGEIRLLDTDQGMPLGLMEKTVYSDGREALETGDTIVLYTDGITEAMDTHHRLYGTERLVDLVRQKRGLPPDRLVEAIRLDARKFERRAPQHDDMTVLAIRIV